MKHFALMLLMTMVLGGCAVSTVDTSISDEDLMKTESSLLTGVPAADKLLQQGDAARQQGDYSGAVSYLERAMRMAPRAPALYLALAKTRLAMGQYNSASQMAQRAISLLPAAPQGVEQSAKVEAWLVVAQARENAGDADGGKQARERAREING